MRANLKERACAIFECHVLDSTVHRTSVVNPHPAGVLSSNQSAIQVKIRPTVQVNIE